MAQRLIDADVVIKHIEEYWEMVKRGKPSRGMTAVMQSIKTIVNSLQTVDAEPHWILTGDAEPEHCHMVLISVFNAKSDMRFVDTGALYSDGWYGSGLKLPDCCIVTAWQELPKPYEVNHE